ncbi:hypothetical protein HJFPF1_09456 [Paramyrothecium foliicola]|nr:hypothetical protein HJFPF1_09456 [Paramyrothecium foliicola]
MEWTKKNYPEQYDKWVPWMEDMYLRWFTKDNKVSYTTKRKKLPHLYYNTLMMTNNSAENLDKTKVTGVEQVDNLQDGVNNLVAGQVGKGGLLQPIGDLASKEGVNRAERQGKDDEGGYVPTSVPGAGAMNTTAGSVADGGKAVAGKTTDGLKGAGSYVGGMFGGGGKKEEQAQEKK